MNDDQITKLLRKAMTALDGIRDLDVPFDARLAALHRIDSYLATVRSQTVQRGEGLALTVTRREIGE